MKFGKAILLIISTQPVALFALPASSSSLRGGNNSNSIQGFYEDVTGKESRALEPCPPVFPCNSNSDCPNSHIVDYRCNSAGFCHQRGTKIPTGCTCYGSSNDNACESGFCGGTYSEAVCRDRKEDGMSCNKNSECRNLSCGYNGENYKTCGDCPTVTPCTSDDECMDWNSFLDGAVMKCNEAGFCQKGIEKDGSVEWEKLPTGCSCYGSSSNDNACISANCGGTVSEAVCRNGVKEYPESCSNDEECASGICDGICMKDNQESCDRDRECFSRWGCNHTERGDSGPKKCGKPYGQDCTRSSQCASGICGYRGNEWDKDSWDKRCYD